MKILVIGGGPSGLYFSYLIKRAHPGIEIKVVEQNPNNATFGFGVVFSDKALEFLHAGDEQTYNYLMPHMKFWSDLKIVHKDEHMAIDGNGFAAIGRLQLLKLLQSLCLEIGVLFDFNTEFKDINSNYDYDYIIAADGANSSIRKSFQEEFKSSETILKNPFIWFGTTKLFDCLSLTFRLNKDGVFCAHHYPYNSEMSTFIVETDPETYKKAGFSVQDEHSIKSYCEQVFVTDLEGHELLTNKSVWRWFPQIWNERWSYENIVLIGDALHTAHFSIGSGTRLAMEDAICLFEAINEHQTDKKSALSQYEEKRRPKLEKLIDASIASALWYERMGELVKSLQPYEFAKSYMTRTGRVSDKKLKLIAPNFMEKYSNSNTS